MQARCRSSELCLEWEAALTADHPFCKPATALERFTHGAVDLEDNTLARFAVLVGQHLERQGLYRTPHEVRELLRYARRDEESGQPVVYASTDAHASRFRGQMGEVPPEWSRGIAGFSEHGRQGSTARQVG